jgi:hypothetical protein
MKSCVLIDTQSHSQLLPGTILRDSQYCKSVDNLAETLEVVGENVDGKSLAGDVTKIVQRLEECKDT